MKHIPPVTLYGTLACHLCEAAMHVLQPLIADGLRVSEVDISDSDELMERYQMRIPVLDHSFLQQPILLLYSFLILQMRVEVYDHKFSK